MSASSRLVLRWDDTLEPSGDAMEFRLTYAGRLLAATADGARVPKRALHIHEVRQAFHKQLKRLWSEHSVLAGGFSTAPVIGSTAFKHLFDREGFQFKPIVTEDNGLICALDILMLRNGPPGRTVYDIDNRLKTLFDALRMARSANELGEGTPGGKVAPAQDEKPFFCLLEDDKFITHLAVTSDMLLDPVEGVPPDESVRLVINVTVRPYVTSMDNADYN